jgi:nitroreductase
MLEELILKNRSYRRFEQSSKLTKELLSSFINLARLSASARNSQPLKYKIVNSPEECAKIFDLVSWAGYIKDWGGPVEGERPPAYIIQLHDKSISTGYFCDDGISAQSILLGAVEKGYGGCILASVQKERAKQILSLPENLDVIQAIAIGKPTEKVVIEDIKGGDIKYYRDKNNIHHVPKRLLEDIII